MDDYISKPVVKSLMESMLRHWLVSNVAYANVTTPTTAQEHNRE